MNDKSEVKSRKMLNIQLLRVFSCLSVVFVHVARDFHWSGVIGSVAEIGAYAPVFFLIISSYLAFVGMEKVQGADEIWRYYRKRLKRILPCYYCILIIYFILHHVIVRDINLQGNIWNWIKYFFVLQGVFPGDDPIWYNMGGVWVLSSILFFYLLAPWLYKTIRNWYAAALLYMFSLVIGYLMEYQFNVNEVHILVNLSYSILGVLACQIVKSNYHKIFAVFAIAGNALFLKINNLHLSEKWYLQTHQYALWFVAIMVLSAEMKLPEKPNKAQGILNNVLQRLDRYSYAIYLFHPIVLYVIKLF